MLVKRLSPETPRCVVGVEWAAGVAGSASAGYLLQALWPFLLPNGPQELPEMLAETISCKSCGRFCYRMDRRRCRTRFWSHLLQIPVCVVAATRTK